MDRRLRIATLTFVTVVCFVAAGWLWHSSSAPHTAVPSATESVMPSASEASAPSSASAGAKRAGRGGSTTESAHALEKTPPLPLRPGETLDYSADLANLTNVATLRLVVAQRQNFFGRPAWHLQAFAHTQNPLRMLFAVDDQFDSYSDASTLTSFQYEMHLSERGDTFDRYFRMTTGREPAPPNATAARVLPGTRDPLGMIQFLRTVDWKKTPEVGGPVFDGQKLYDVRARIENPAVTVTVAAGTFTASRIAVRVFQKGKELKDTHFALHLANDGAHTPVLLEAAIPLADARVELVGAK